MTLEALMRGEVFTVIDFFCRGEHPRGRRTYSDYKYSISVMQNVTDRRLIKELLPACFQYAVPRCLRQHYRNILTKYIVRFVHNYAPY